MSFIFLKLAASGTMMWKMCRLCKLYSCTFKKKQTKKKQTHASVQVKIKIYATMPCYPSFLLGKGGHPSVSLLKLSINSKVHFFLYMHNKPHDALV